MNDEDDFFLTDKRQRLLQIDSIILDECGQACSSHPK